MTGFVLPHNGQEVLFQEQRHSLSSLVSPFHCGSTIPSEMVLPLSLYCFILLPQAVNQCREELTRAVNGVISDWKSITQSHGTLTWEMHQRAVSKHPLKP